LKSADVPEGLTGVEAEKLKEEYQKDIF